MSSSLAAQRLGDLVSPNACLASTETNSMTFLGSRVESVKDSQKLVLVALLMLSRCRCVMGEDALVIC